MRSTRPGRSISTTCSGRLGHVRRARASTNWWRASVACWPARTRIRPLYVWHFQRRRHLAVPRRVVHGRAYPARGRRRDRSRTRRDQPDRARGAESERSRPPWSVDLPYPFDHRLHVQTGAAVTDGAGPAGRIWRARASSGFRRWSPRSAGRGIHPRQPAHGRERGVRNGAGGQGDDARRGHAGGRHQDARGIWDLCQEASRIRDHHLPVGRTRSGCSASPSRPQAPSGPAAAEGVLRAQAEVPGEEVHQRARAGHG